MHVDSGTRLSGSHVQMDTGTDHQQHQVRSRNVLHELGEGQGEVGLLSGCLYRDTVIGCGILVFTLDQVSGIRI